MNAFTRFKSWPNIGAVNGSLRSIFNQATVIGHTNDRLYKSGDAFGKFEVVGKCEIDVLLSAMEISVPGGASKAHHSSRFKTFGYSVGDLQTSRLGEESYTGFFGCYINVVYSCSLAVHDVHGCAKLRANLLLLPLGFKKARQLR